VAEALAFFSISGVASEREALPLSSNCTGAGGGAIASAADAGGFGEVRLNSVGEAALAGIGRSGIECGEFARGASVGGAALADARVSDAPGAAAGAGLFATPR